MTHTDEQVERVAIAMWNSEAPERMALEPEAVDSDLARKYWRLARAALSAMPTPESQAIRNAALQEVLIAISKEMLPFPTDNDGDAAYNTAISHAVMSVRTLIDQPAPALETCQDCMGTGISGHPDSGYTCFRCKGQGGQPAPRCAECDCEHGGENCNWIAQPAPAPVWKPSDGDTVCQNCGQPNPIWFAPNEVWNRIVGGPDATDDPGGVLCPCCFMAKGDDGIVVWEVRPEIAPAPVSEEDRENIVDEIESIISETHEMDVRDIDYAENIVGWLERHHPDALRALTKGDTDD